MVAEIVRTVPHFNHSDIGGIIRSIVPQSPSHLPTIGPLIVTRLLIVLATVLAMLGPTTGSSQTYPSRPVRIVIGFAPGGTPDVFARLIAQKMSYASVGSGSIHHITTELFKSMTGTDILHVPYKGAGPGGQALLAGEVQVAFLSYTSVAQYVKAGKVRILAISMSQRSEALPDVPTMHEAGVPGFEMHSSLDALAPAGTPREIIAKLNAGIAAAIGHPEVAARMTGFGVRNVIGGTPEQFGAVIRGEHEKFGRLVKLSGAKLE
jgi:tripartite-type tricarboxylate transporter receptor subunit TctC